MYEDHSDSDCQSHGSKWVVCVSACASIAIAFWVVAMVNSTVLSGNTLDNEVRDLSSVKESARRLKEARAIVDKYGVAQVWESYGGAELDHIGEQYIVLAAFVKGDVRFEEDVRKMADERMVLAVGVIENYERRIDRDALNQVPK